MKHLSHSPLHNHLAKEKVASSILASRSIAST
jgi:hypothetical protein